METVTSEILGFADTGDSRNKVLGDTLIGVTKTTSGDAEVTVDFLGDFGDFNTLYPDEWFSVNIDGYDLGKFQGLESKYTSSTHSISAADWASIIGDGTINITYTMGPEVDNLDTDPNEFVKLTFSWEKPVRGEPGPTKITGTGNDDVLAGDSGKNVIMGLAGNDTISGGANNDIAKGGLGDDNIDGGDSSDALYGGEGKDTLRGGQGNDYLKGANGDDVIGGGGGNDDIHGGAGHDKLMGSDGNDELFGNKGNDSLLGGLGKDTLDGGQGNDKLAGGFGIDTFIFGKNEGDDVIRDFEAGRDVIELGTQTYTVVESTDGDAVLELSGGGSVTLLGISIDDINSDWFL